MEKREEDCTDCGKVLPLEKVMAVTGLVAGLLIIAFAVDLLAGGRLADTFDGIGRNGGSDE